MSVTYIRMHAGYKNVNTQLQQYHAFVVRVCVSLAPLRRTIFQLAALVGTGLVKVETNYTTPHPRIKSINKSQKQQERRRQGQKQQQKQEQEQQQKKKGTVQPASFYISQCALGPQSLVHNTFNLPDKQRTPNTISPASDSKYPNPSVSLPPDSTRALPCPAPFPLPCGRFSLSFSHLSPSHPLCYCCICQSCFSLLSFISSFMQNFIAFSCIVCSLGFGQVQRRIRKLRGMQVIAIPCSYWQKSMTC